MAFFKYNARKKKRFDKISRWKRFNKTRKNLGLKPISYRKFIKYNK